MVQGIQTTRAKNNNTPSVTPETWMTMLEVSSIQMVQFPNTWKQNAQPDNVLWNETHVWWLIRMTSYERHGASHHGQLTVFSTVFGITTTKLRITSRFVMGIGTDRCSAQSIGYTGSFACHGIRAMICVPWMWHTKTSSRPYFSEGSQGYSTGLRHIPVVPHSCVNESDQHWFG